MKPEATTELASTGADVFTMRPRIPDLWASGEDAERLYSLFLLQLWMTGHHDRVITAARRIRQYATHGPGPKAALFTYHFEIDVLCELGRFREAWRQQRQKDRSYFGRSIDYARHQWPDELGHQLLYSTGPLLFFTGQYELGRHLMECGLEVWFRGGRPSSYDWLHRVITNGTRPILPAHVSLWHFYQKLHRDLGQWRHWESYVDGFPDQFFRAIGVHRDALRKDAGLLRKISRRIREIMDERCTSGCTQGIEDIVGKASEVRRWHQKLLKKRKSGEPARRERSDHFDNKLLELFPELRKTKTR